MNSGQEHDAWHYVLPDAWDYVLADRGLAGPLAQRSEDEKVQFPAEVSGVLKKVGQLDSYIDFLLEDDSLRRPEMLADEYRGEGIYHVLRHLVEYKVFWAVVSYDQFTVRRAKQVIAQIGQILQNHDDEHDNYWKLQERIQLAASEPALEALDQGMSIPQIPDDLVFSVAHKLLLRAMTDVLASLSDAEREKKTTTPISVAEVEKRLAQRLPITDTARGVLMERLLEHACESVEELWSYQHRTLRGERNPFYGPVRAIVQELLS